MTTYDQKTLRMALGFLETSIENVNAETERLKAELVVANRRNRLELSERYGRMLDIRSALQRTTDKFVGRFHLSKPSLATGIMVWDKRTLTAIDRFLEAEVMLAESNLDIVEEDYKDMIKAGKRRGVSDAYEQTERWARRATALAEFKENFERRFGAKPSRVYTAREKPAQHSLAVLAETSVREEKML